MKRKRTMVILLSLVMMFTLGISAQAKSKGKAKISTAYKAYLNWINSGCKDRYGHATDYDKFCLVRVDSDRVPELVARKTPGPWTGVYHMCVVSYKKGKIVKETVSSGVAGAGGYRGYTSFMPGKGKVHIWSMSSGNGYEGDKIIKLGKTGFKVAAEGSYHWTDYIGGHAAGCSWNKKSVTKAVYDKKLAKAFNESAAMSFDNLPYIERTSMIQALG